MYYVGIDWADQKYDITIVDRHGTIILQNFTIKKNAAGFEQLLEKLRQLSADPQQVQTGIETPNNLVVDFLVDMGYAVFALFPGAMKSLRKRYRTSGARDDQFDAFVIADTLRTDHASPRSSRSERSTPAASNVAISRGMRSAASRSIMASAAPVPSPKRICRSSSGWRPR